MRFGRLFPPKLLRAAIAALLISYPLGHIAWGQIGSDRYSSIVVEASGGNVLEAVNPDALRHPASLTKLMTLYMTFEGLQDRRISLNSPVPVSAYAASMEPAKLGLLPGSYLTVEQAILGLITKSANDAASALAELLGGSEDRFAQMMTLRARALGMSHSVFTNASGLPDPDQWTTARDLALLARRIQTDFPNQYPYFSTPSFVFHHRVVFNHDNLLKSYPGADGMKTGYTEASGHNLVTSALRGGVRLIGVVLGAGSNTERDTHMAVLLDRGFDDMDVPIEPRVARATGGLGLVGSAHAAAVATTRPPVSTIRGASSPSWGIQVGSYRTEPTAYQAASLARRALEVGELRVEVMTSHGHTGWRAQV
ncbi:MAG: D-alanyl-D-alanine carboxypeptidase, partial [Acetobacteraceae bacterium]|nr:D-alanyl-D-alanine carboxypeptidase [Acetobacteraceae bacterium]